MNELEKCQVPNCINVAKIKKHKLCRTHYSRLLKGYDMHTPVIPRDKYEPYRFPAELATKG